MSTLCKCSKLYKRLLTVLALLLFSLIDIVGVFFSDVQIIQQMWYNNCYSLLSI